jgi:hypothetical protein
MHGSGRKIPNKNLVWQRCAKGFNSGVKGLNMASTKLKRSFLKFRLLFTQYMDQSIPINKLLNLKLWTQRLGSTKHKNFEDRRRTYQNIPDWCHKIDGSTSLENFWTVYYKRRVTRHINIFQVVEEETRKLPRYIFGTWETKIWRIQETWSLRQQQRPPGIRRVV